MRIKKIIPLKEKISSEKTTIIDESGNKKVIQGNDFFRIIPTESEYDKDIQTILESEFAEGNILVAGNYKIGEIAEKYSINSITIKNQQNLIKTLEEMYAKKIKPNGVVFDYNYHQVSPHTYLHEIYVKQNLNMFRHLPVIVLNYDGDSSLMVSKIKVLAVNGSPRKNGDTKRLLREEVSKYWTGPYYESSFIDLKSISECLACGGHQKNCEPDCIIDDQMKELLPKVKETDVLLLGSPVYMDLPTARTIAFLSRLTGQTKFNRRAYIGKYASALSPAWCSGTKAVIGALTNALEMMGFEIQGRSSREYIKLWADEKTRGGVPDDFFWPE